jgi:DNA-binding response OmpR family regulator
MTARILIVDDDEHITKALCVRLRAHGYEVARAFDGLQAVEQAVAFEPHLIVMDVNMPAGGGVRAAARIGELMDTPVIFITASKQAEIRAEVESVGAADLIEKPLDTAHFLARVREVVGER